MKTPRPETPIRNALKHLALALTMGAAMYFGASPANAAPPVTGGLTLHLDASALTGLSDNDPVPTWFDVSGSLPANDATAAGAPIYKTGALNGQPVIRFDDFSSFTTADLSASFLQVDPNPTAANIGTGGSGINGTYVNTPTRGVTGALVGASDTATTFSGSNQYVSIPFSPDLNPPQGQPWSAEIWAKSNALGVLPPFSSGTPGNVPNRQGWVLYFFNSDLSFRAYTNNGPNATINGTGGLTIPGLITPNTWYHVVVTCDGTDFKIFLNGVEVGTTPTVGPGGTYSAGTTGTALGHRLEAGNYFNGTLDEAAFYTTTLSQPRVQAHYQNGINDPARSQAYDLEIAADSPVAHYKLNEPAAPVVAATGFIVTTIDNDDAYTLVKANPGVDEWWRWDGDGTSYPGFFRGGRLESYTAMPNSGSHLLAISSSPSAWEMSINGTSKGVAGGNYNAGGELVIGNGSSGAGLRGDIAEVLIYNRVLTPQEANAVGYYLGDKYGISSTYENPNPTVPQNLQAVAGDRQVSLTWSAFPGAVSYNVKRSGTPGGPYTTVGTPAGPLLTNSSLANGTPYYYVVSANTGSESPNSSEKSETPTGVNATLSTVTGSQPGQLANGVASVTFTVTLRNSSNTPIPGKVVTLAGTGSPSITTVTGTTGADGRAVFTATSTTVGTAVFTATDTTDSNLVIAQTAAVDFFNPNTPLAINVNMDSTVQPGLEGPGGGLGAVWNTIGASSASNLLLAFGSPSTVGFTSSGTGNWFFTDTADFEPTLRLLKRGYANFGADGTTQQLVITGLDPAKTYDLSIASAIVITTNQCTRGEWSTTNTTSTTGNQAVDNRLDENSATWVQGNNYVLFEDVVPDVNGKITVNGFAITEQPTYDIRLPLNGFQLVEASAPSKFQITKVVRTETGDVILTFPSASGSIYRVEASTDLENWIELDDSVAGQPVETNYLDDTFARLPLPGKAEAFYRVTRLP